jgi:hypothetical protein
VLVACATNEAPEGDSAAAMTDDTAMLTRADLAGTWSGTTMVADGDSVVNTWTSRVDDSMGKLLIVGTTDSIPHRITLEGDIEAQHLAGEIAYRASRWAPAITYLRRGGTPGAQPELTFYLAVALWESGERQEAARVLETALPRLPRNEFVDGYAERILGRPR